MILVCPSCDAKFKIPDGAIPPEGRTVRCAKCKNSWHAKPEQIMRKQAPKPQAARPKPAAAAAPAPRRPEPEPVAFDGKLDDQAAADAAALRQSVRGSLMEDEPPQIDEPMQDDTFDEDIGGGPTERQELDEDTAASDDFGVSAALKSKLGNDFQNEFEDDGTKPDGPDADHEDDYDDEEYDEDDFLARRRADQRRQYERDSVGRQRKLMTIGWGGLVLFWVIVLYAFIFEEENMRHYLPGTNVVYGLFEGVEDKERFRPDDGEPLTPSPALAEEYVRAMLHPSPRGLSVETRSGRQGLMLRGFVENAGTTGANVPQVRAAILDANGNELDSWIFNPAGLIIRRGGRIEFEEFRTPVPQGAAQAKVEVLEGSKSERDARDDQ